MEQTTLPRYPAAGRSPAPHLVIAVGAAEPPAPRPGDRLRTIRCGADADELLDAELATMVTGWRILVTGTESDVQQVRSAALARGALDSELELRPTDVDAGPEALRPRTVHCGHCHTRFSATAAIGGAVHCPACGCALVVAHHHSRTHAAFLGSPA
ncbi:hypothetical protein PSA01_39610 [Pseudonocardia saturnea]|uniref:Dimethylamine monooxygenase subunit DmmA-like C-terminal domain-containing protein n=1 Tax=Pseudonocardia saturnea TaxID=33909 RepID=A0ABQ0S1Y6_9PSEU|nr:hypothetical protein Pdca_36960 [Pseudonocardia autotrophica]GEC26932.1 hypothetical protein PSA01_39610 [Pseudonocardia saturnea]